MDKNTNYSVLSIIMGVWAWGTILPLLKDLMNGTMPMTVRSREDHSMEMAPIYCFIKELKEMEMRND